jgi:hypothetical protein
MDYRQFVRDLMKTFGRNTSDTTAWRAPTSCGLNRASGSIITRSARGIRGNVKWFYIPAHDMVTHFIMVFGAFIIPARRPQRSRSAIVISIRAGAYFLAAVADFFPDAALGYVVAYLIMMTVLRFMDALQHDYGGIPVLFEDVKMPAPG